MRVPPSEFFPLRGVLQAGMCVTTVVNLLTDSSVVMAAAQADLVIWAMWLPGMQGVGGGGWGHFCKLTAE